MRDLLSCLDCGKAGGCSFLDRGRRVMNFKLPNYQGYSAEIVNKLKKQLKFSGSTIKGFQIIVGGILPILEGILINLATGAGASSAWWKILFGIGLLHITLLIIILVIETPLPQFLIQFDELAHKINELSTERNIYKMYTSVFSEVVTASQASLLELRHSGTESLAEIIASVLLPWIELRTEIFLFQEGDAFYNFAIYLQKADDPNWLEVFYRECDSRLQTQNRSWQSGDGHVGQCFLLKKTIFLNLSEGSESLDFVATSQPREEDRKYYRSMVATPISISNEIKGVFIITSSKRDQFVKELHAPIVEVVGLLLSQAFTEQQRKPYETREKN